MFVTIKNVYSRELDSRLLGKIIVLDAGHGGKDRGTSVGNVYESDINLSLVLKLEKELNQHGVDVILTRNGDYDLSVPYASRRKKSDFDNRISLINDSGADLYLSIHINFLDDSRYYGAQVFYIGDNQKLADYIQLGFKNVTGSPMKCKKMDNSIYMYKKLLIPGVLVEAGFISNEKERKLLQTDSYQDKIVRAIVDGLLNFYS